MEGLFAVRGFGAAIHFFVFYQATCIGWELAITTDLEAYPGYAFSVGNNTDKQKISLVQWFSPRLFPCVILACIEPVYALYWQLLR